MSSPLATAGMNGDVEPAIAPGVDAPNGASQAGDCYDAVALVAADYCVRHGDAAAVARYPRNEGWRAMRMLSKAMRYRALAARETNKAIIGLLHRVADEVERKQSRARPVGVSAEIILFPQRPASINQGLMGIHVWPASKRAS